MGAEHRAAAARQENAEAIIKQAQQRRPNLATMCVLRKTIARSVQFMISALFWRKPERHHAPIAWSLLAGWIWLLTTLQPNPTSLETGLAGIFLSGVLVAVCAIDSRFGIIPDSLVAMLACGAVVHLTSMSGIDGLRRLPEAGLLFAGAYSFRAIYRRIRGYHGLGLGDVKFATAGVLWTDITTLPYLLGIAVLSALVSLLILKADGNVLHRQQAISFGPHLAIGIWLSWIASAPI